ncbi:MAG: ABC transporter permease [Cyclobacteriaceae bacterium]
MFDLEKWQEIFETLKRHKLRTGLTAFGVFWGIFMLVVLLGATNGLENGVMTNFNIAKNTVFMWTQRTGKAYMGLQPGRFIRLKTEDTEAILREVPEVKTIAPRLRLQQPYTVLRGTNNASYEVLGDYPAWGDVQDIPLSAGRFINALDIEERRKIAVIGERVRDVLFEDGSEPVGQYISIKGIFFKVVGVFGSKRMDEQAMEDLERIHIPNTTMQYTFNQVGQVGWYAFVPQDGISASVVEDKVKALLQQRHRVAPDDIKAFGSANIEEEYKEVQGLFLGMKGFGWLVSIGTIIAGIIGVSNIMLIIVRERTREIGVRKALGARPSSILSLIIQESLVLTAVSGYFGLVAGTLLIEGVAFALEQSGGESEFFLNPQIDFSVALMALGVLVAAGTIAGFLPAYKAARVNPVVALKDE